jgi:tRNA threonylcarbamoyladenosine biosynthesis protein TsaB
LKILGFDTATDDTVVAATDQGETVFEKLIGPGGNGRPVHSEMLLATMNEAAGELGGWADINRIAVGIGPGTFTGIRIGIATANGLALSAGIELVGVSTLEALALPMRGGGEEVLALLDARRGEVFAALYGPDGEEKWPPVACPPEELIARVAELDRSPRVGGPGAVRFIDELTRAGMEIAGPEAAIHHLSGRYVCELGARAGRVDQSIPLEPLYLRVPDAQLWLQRDGTNGSHGGA